MSQVDGFFVPIALLFRCSCKRKKRLKRKKKKEKKKKKGKKTLIGVRKDAASAAAHKDKRHWHQRFLLKFYTAKPRRWV